jgi:membrane associated rhomboid family serine protease
MRPVDGGVPRDGNPAAVPHCYRHPQREALVRCTRCDRPICPECMRPAAVGFHCPEDVAVARRTQRRPRTSVGARLRDSPPYVTGALVAANVIVYLITGAQSRQGLTDPGSAPINGLFTKWQLFLPAVHDQDQYYRLVTSGFLHVSLLHIASNMLALVIIGPPLERLLGRWRFLAVYFAGLLGGSAMIYLLGNHLQPVVGASGAIFGLFGAALVMARRLGLDLQWLIGIIVLNFVFTFSIADVSKLGHIGGFLGGLLAAVAIAGVPSRRQRLSMGSQLAGLGGVAALIIVTVLVANSAY